VGAEGGPPEVSAEDAKKTDWLHVRLPQEVRDEVARRVPAKGLSKYVRDAVVARLKRDRKRKV
jgi:hypothetical protein